MDYEEPTFYFRRKKRFKSQTYLVWACHELIDLIENNWDEDPVELLEYFINEVEGFSVRTRFDDNPFEVALSVARNVLDTLRAAM